ncbi:penicillin-binding protein [Lutibacter sp. B2]|nr:penicillin-binding protein [Lutibacter sp. B2]
MLEKLKDRHNQMMIFFTLFIMILFMRLFILTIIEGNEYKKKADEIRIKKIPITAQRGEIRDRYGRPLAVNKPSFTVQIMKNELIDEKINGISVKLLNILQKNGEKYNDNLPIEIENEQFYYTFDKEIKDWIDKNKYFLEGVDVDRINNGEKLFNALRKNLEIDPKLTVFEAQSIMQKEHEIYPPISVKTMKFIPQMKKENFLKKYSLDKKLDAREAFFALKEKFKIPNSYSNDNTRKILIVRNELKDQGYRQYQPVKLAMNVNEKTIAEIEENNMDLPGVNIEVEPIRYYPNDNLASHSIGYLGKISDVEIEKYTKELGYLQSDLIGKDGIEHVFENELKGKDGAKYVEVDVYGRLVNTLRQEAPKKGKNIYLTIDTKLQKVAEDSLKHALEQIQKGGTFKSKWGDYKYSEAYPHATSGAVVVLDVNTGEVLALANYPSFDPNLFATGILSKDWKTLQGENPRDQLSPLPLFNVATKTAVQPGSIFKMITGLAALEGGMNPSQKLYDNGHIMLGGKSYGCWIWNDYHGKHGWVDLFKALEVSCNYYFYNVSTAWDHYKNKPLNIDMNVDKILKYASMFGLGQRTGIEISESAYGVPDPKRKMKSTENSLIRILRLKQKEYFKDEILQNEEEIENQIHEIAGWIKENPSRGTLIKRIEKLDVKEDKVVSLTDMIKYSYFNQSKWTKGDTFNLAIGQGEHSYTPLQMTNYIATLANGGYKNKVSIVRKVGEKNQSIMMKKDSKNKLDLKNDVNLSYVKQGMANVTQGEEGTGRRLFMNFPIKVAGKTGTAQKSGKIQPKDEVAYLNKHLKWIAPNIDRELLERKTNEYKEEYHDDGVAMRQAIKDITKGKVTNELMDRFKEDYDNFAWFASYAPIEKPQIAVVALAFQGGHGGYIAPVAKEIMAEYFKIEEEYDKIILKNTLVN